MISYLKGELAGAGEGIAVVDVGGMGFRVFITDRDQADLPAVGEPVQLYTYLSVREDAIWLYGFLSEEDRQVFRQLLTVSGVGPKAALGILSALSANDLRFAVFSDDVKAISKAPGVGLKTAKKLILELKDRLKLEDAI
ncbi:MAG TPA: Holliday junction branch migration protein RuvA, partial [Lachnospiraceae bacterium]|nr:Holliday junction branch migration protein RuvA [Lachnospiraceae bacterium]